MSDIVFATLKGKVIEEVIGLSQYSDLVRIKTTDGIIYELTHFQDCCENVQIEDIIGDINDIIGSEILVAEEVEGNTPEDMEEPSSESYTWTFYKLDTIKGGITIRWLGESNGYYSESVSCSTFRPNDGD